MFPEVFLVGVSFAEYPFPCFTQTQMNVLPLTKVDVNKGALITKEATAASVHQDTPWM